MDESILSQDEEPEELSEPDEEDSESQNAEGRAHRNKLKAISRKLWQ